MTPILKPNGRPDPDILVKRLGLSASSCHWPTRKIFEARVADVIAQIQRLTKSPSVSKCSEHSGEDYKTYVVYVLENAGASRDYDGTVSFAFGGDEVGRASIKATLPWASIVLDTYELVKTLDELWGASSLDTLYAYDEDDYIIQNLRIPIAMAFHGISDSQVEFVKKGPLTQIDPQSNPGYWVNEGGLHKSIQWLNYWSMRAQKLLFGGPIPRTVPAGVELRDLDEGAVCFRLAERPGQYDDVAFHQLQLDCRKCLGLIP
jgi:hypothetical protein